MGKVLEIGISENSKGEIRKQPFVEAIAGKGLVNDTHLKRTMTKGVKLLLLK